MYAHCRYIYLSFLQSIQLWCEYGILKCQGHRSNGNEILLTAMLMLDMLVILKRVGNPFFIFKALLLFLLR